MSNVTSIRKYKNREIISIDEDTVHLVFEAFFEIPIDIFGVCDKEEKFVGFSAIIDALETKRCKYGAAACVWNKSFQGRIFDNKYSILMTYMDCYMEQNEL